MNAANKIEERYAESLLALSEGAGVLARIEKEIMMVVDLFASDSRIKRFLADPAVQDEGKSTAVVEILSGRVHPVLMRFVQILLDQNMIGGLRCIADMFLDKASRLEKKVSGELVSVCMVGDDVLTRIEEEISRILGKKVRLHVRIDSEMLGGAIVRVGDLVVDGSVDALVDGMRSELLGGLRGGMGEKK